MSKKFLSAIFILILQVTICAQNPGDNIFSGIKVHTIKLKFTQPNYWDSLTTYYNQGNEQYMVASVSFDGGTIDSCGVRLKGNSSYSHPNNKKPMKIDFNQYRDNQKLDGLNGLFINNCFADPSFIREKIHLDFCREAGIPAPRASFAMVYINDVVWGLYSIVEPVDKKFLTSRYGNKDGNLYKAVDAFGAPGPGGQTVQVLSDFCWYGTTSSFYTSHYELKTDDSANPWTEIMAVIDAINKSTSVAEALPAKVNLSSVYKAIGTDIIFANLDSYTESGRNYYVYFNSSTQKMEWIIWDVNMSFGGYPGKTITPETLSLTYTSSVTGRPLVGKIFNTSSLKTEYLKTVNAMFNKYFSASRFFPHIDSIASVIRPYVLIDTKKQYTIDQFDSNITSDISVAGGAGGGAPGGPPGGGTERKPGIKSFITARQANVKTQLANLGYTDITSVESEKEIPAKFSLSQNYPNPFNPSTVIEYSLPVSGQVNLRVYDLLGREIVTLVDEYKSAGLYSVNFNTANKIFSSGVYFYKLTCGNFSQTRKMILAK